MNPRSTKNLDPRMEKLSAAALMDAIGRSYRHRSHILDLVSPTPGRKLFGRAATIRYIPYRSDMSDGDALTFGRFFYEAVGDHPQGVVLVLDSSGRCDVSVGGAAKFSRLQNHRLAGLVTDARIRDFDELAALDPVFYCRGQAVRAGTEQLTPVAANVPVNLGGTTVLPGDYIYADSAGVVVIPGGALDQVLQSAAEIDAEDKASLSVILHEDPQEVRKAGSGES